VNKQPSTGNYQLAKTFSGKKVWLSGISGFKGAWLAEWLLSLGAEIRGFSLPPPTAPSLFEQTGLASRVTWDCADLRDADKVRASLIEAQPDFVFHLAAQPLVRLSYREPLETWNTNVMGTIHVLEALRGLSKECVAVMITTDKCYENREWLHGYREEDPLGGYDPYSSSKAACELAIASWRRSFFSPQPLNSSSAPSAFHFPPCSADAPVASPATPSCFPYNDKALPRGCSAFSQPSVLIASARAGNVIGGGDWAQDRIVPDCIRALEKGEAIPVRNKTATRPWQHVLEPLGGYLTLAAKMKVSSQFGVDSCVQPANQQQPTTNQEHAELCSAFNFGPALDSNRTVADIVKEILKHWPGEWQDKSDPDAPHEAGKLNLATDKAFHLLGWRPKWDFPTTIEKTVAWYKESATCQNPEEFSALTRRQIKEYAES